MNTGVAILKDNKKQIESTFKKIEAGIEKCSKTNEASDRKNIIRSLEMDLRSIKDVIDTMKMEINSLNNEDLEQEYKNYLRGYRVEYDKHETEIKKLKEQRAIDLDDIRVMDKMKIEEATAQQLMDRGDQVIGEGDDAISRMLKKLTETKDVSNQIKVNLVKQREQLEATQKNLKEIDYSLDRATKTLKTMLRSYATDKIVLGLIVIIVLAIIAIVIVAAVGGDKTNMFNVPHDWFVNAPANTTASTTKAT